MKLAIDCRMIGSGGIGTYISELIPYFLEVSTYPNWCSRISSITDNLNSGEYFLNICPFFAIKNAPPKSV